MCRVKRLGMRLRRINRPKAAIITAKQRLLIMVEKCEAVERECACRGAIRLPDEQSEEPCEARSRENPNHRSIRNPVRGVGKGRQHRRKLGDLQVSLRLDKALFAKSCDTPLTCKEEIW